jgi:CheY-like chemotaxis protein
MSLHLLLAEDDPDIRLVSKAALKRAGYRVTAAVDGREVLARVVEDRPDVILLDVMMPEMDGIEACRRLKEDPRTSDIPIIFLTARSQGFQLEDAKRLGAAGYIGKPYDALTLGTQVQAILEESR